MADTGPQGQELRAARALGPRSSGSGWRAGNCEFRWIIAILLALFAGYQAAYFVIIATRSSPGPAGDAFYLWIWAKSLISHPAVEIYDQAKLKAVQVALGMSPQAADPFVFPPTIMLVLAPLGRLPYRVAYGFAIGASLLLYLWATVGREWRSPALLAGLVAPTTTLTVVAGQTGFLSGALLIGGLRLATRHPVLGGMLLGLLTYKPQLGLLVPIALASAGLWRAVAVATGTLLALVAITSAAFGWSVWPTWITATEAFSSQFAAQAGELRHLMPTVWASLLQLGFTQQAAWAGQLLATLAVAAVVWFCFRQGATPLAIAALLVGAFLTTPYAFVYDMPMVSTAVIWLVVERCRSGGVFQLGEAALLVLAMFVPCLMLMPELRLPIGVICLVLLLGTIFRRNSRVRQEA
ncbi:MAG TPA: glycosyltransferase family 87 protein [Stellaceae bacterium]|nr:glycosyltransferase family 87 protein [Stellaceae bacterium]